MTYYTIPPPPHLANYVRFFWVLECEVSPGSPYIHRCMADGCPELLFHYKGHFDRLNDGNKSENCFTSGLQAQSQEFKRFSANENLGMFGIYLYPNAIPELFHIDAPELVNAMPDLQLLLGRQSDALEDKMMLAKDNTERVAIVTAFLETRLASVIKKRPEVTQTIHHMIRTKGIGNVEELAARNFLSVRQFERHFKSISGFSPKLFSRIVRFQSALAEYDNRHKSLTQIAYDCGYYDQSHFIRDFREFSGHYPGEFFSGKSEALAFR